MKVLFEKFVDAFVSLIEGLASPFVYLAAIIDETRRENLDGRYNKYWAKKNMRAELKEIREQYRSNRKYIKDKWLKPFKKI